MRAFETLLSVKGMPAAAAAFARAMSPRALAMPLSPVGATISGAADSTPKIVRRQWRRSVLTSVLGTRRIESNMRRFQRSVASSSAPPSMYSKAKAGKRRRAMLRSSSMLMAS